jgi:hypothetical protein
MSQMHNEPDALSVRASDAERDQAAGVLRAAFAEGRLTRAELDERLAAAYAAKSRADLPGAVPAEVTAYDRLPVADPGPNTRLSLCVLLCLLFCFPPAGIAFAIYWIVTARRRPQPAAGEPFLSPGA